MSTNQRDLAAATWRKASKSNTNGNCVEIARAGGVAGVRDSKDREAGHLTVSAPAFDAFLAGVRAGEFDLR